MDPQKLLNERFLARKISAKKYEKMEKFLEKNMSTKIEESDSDFFHNLDQLEIQYASGEFNEKEFKHRKKILEKQEKKLQKEENKRNKIKGRSYGRFRRGKDETTQTKSQDNIRRDIGSHESDNKRKCLECGFVDSGNFCSKCGSPFPKEPTINEEQKINCPRCGFLDYGKFCSHCGESLLDDSPRHRDSINKQGIEHEPIRSKTKQELLEEYEKDYVTRVEEKSDNE